MAGTRCPKPGVQIQCPELGGGGKYHCSEPGGYIRCLRIWCLESNVMQLAHRFSCPECDVQSSMSTMPMPVSLRVTSRWSVGEHHKDPALYHKCWQVQSQWRCNSHKQLHIAEEASMELNAMYARCTSCRLIKLQEKGESFCSCHLNEDIFMPTCGQTMHYTTFFPVLSILLSFAE